MKKRLAGLVVAVLLFLGQQVKAWQPTGWVWFQAPYAYDYQESVWYYMDPNGTAYLYSFTTGTWTRLGEDARTVAWFYFQWPYAYASGAARWYYCDQNTALQCFSFSAEQWSRFGDVTSGNYLVVDLSAGPSASSYPVSYLAAIPAGGWTDEYKTTKLVLRRIPPGTFTMGSPAGELGHDADEAQHQVSLKQFYIGVFEVTQKQWERVMGTWPSYLYNAAYRDSRPVEHVSYNDIRGATAGAGWPADGNVDADTFMGRLRARTGWAFNVPTESQWEYAGRGGSTLAWNDGNSSIVDTQTDPYLAVLGRYWANGGSATTQNGDVSTGTAKVGSYQPSIFPAHWGLYDIHGNVGEWCLDWYGTYPGTVSDPNGPSTGTYRVNRGGSWYSWAEFCRSASRQYAAPSYAEDIGFRVVLPPGQ